MAFDPTEVARLLARCHRRCCVCHRYCGVKMETDHIEQSADGRNDAIDNAIPVCFDCHAEIHSYNDRHPRGRKFTPAELRLHREQWLSICDREPVRLMALQAADPEVGPLQALVDEIEFNLAVAHAAMESTGCPLRDEQFTRAIRSGAVSVLRPDLKRAIIDAYVAVGHASAMGAAAVAKVAGGLTHSLSGTGFSDARGAFGDCADLLGKAQLKLMELLGHDGASAGVPADASRPTSGQARLGE